MKRILLTILIISSQLLIAQYNLQLVKDITTGVDVRSSFPKKLTKIGDTLFFVAYDELNGSELWKSSGTDTSTVLIKDIYPGNRSSSIGDIVELNGLAIFRTTTDTSGTELWRSDGTELGTFLLKEIASGASGSGPDNYLIVNNTLYFAASSSTYGRELWKTDGTTSGTQLVSDIATGINSSFPSDLTVVNDTLIYFLAQNSAFGKELWKTDGTNAGTNIVKDINPGSGGSLISDLIAVDSNLFFLASDSNGKELWISDGTSAGTDLLKDINQGSQSGINNLTNVNGTLFFSANDNIHGQELWKSDGTSSGTVLVKDIDSTTSLGNPVSSNPSNLFKLGDTLYFTASDSAHGTELWKSDGTSSGTVLVQDITTGTRSSTLRNLTAFNGSLIFTKSNFTNELWISNGSQSSTNLVKAFNNFFNFNHPFVQLGDTLYFPANDGFTGNELWKTDGTSSNTNLVKDINEFNTTVGPEDLTIVDGNIYFTIPNDSLGTELWKSDGSTNGTQIVKDIAENRNASSSITGLDTLGNKLVFKERSSIWFTDGTTNGTNLIDAPIVNGSMIISNDTIFFDGYENQSGRELWKTSGSDSGSVLIKDINSGTGNSSFPDNFIEVNGDIFFLARTSASGEELWKTDGSSSGTVLVEDIRQGTSGSLIRNLIESNGTLFFSANNGSDGSELWKSDGTNAGTQLVKDIRTGVSSSGIRNTIDLNGTLIFTASDGSGSGLWKSDGTNAGTQEVKEITTTNRIFPLVTNDTLYFFQNKELWKSDGTNAGTVKVTDIILGSGSYFISPPIAYKNKIYFGVESDSIGIGLWVSDGTSSGTSMLKSFNNINVGGSPYNFEVFEDTLYFVVSETLYGSELWKTDGTSNGTKLLSDIRPGPLGSNPMNLFSTKGSLYFTAVTENYGNELWRYGPCLTTRSTDSIVACDNYTWIDGVTYTSSNTIAKDTLVNSGGCDSVVTLHLTIISSTISIDSIVACDSYTWIDSVTYISSNNTATDTLVNAAGCDSIVTLNLTINSSSAFTDIQTGCNSFTWINGITYTSDNDSAVDTLVNSTGCDSIVTLDLTILNLDTAVFFSQDTLVSNATGAVYQWLDCNNNFSPIPGATAQKFLPNQGGSYALEVTENNCTDTSACFISSVGLEENAINELISIFPNPTNDRVNIETDNTKIAQMALINMNGSVVLEVQRNANSIDVSQLGKGVYYLKIVTSEKGVAFKRIVKL